jgi:hypothetical protein
MRQRYRKAMLWFFIIIITCWIYENKTSTINLHFYYLYDHGVENLYKSIRSIAKLSHDYAAPKSGTCRSDLFVLGEVNVFSFRLSLGVGWSSMLCRYFTQENIDGTGIFFFKSYVHVRQLFDNFWFYDSLVLGMVARTRDDLKYNFFTFPDFLQGCHLGPKCIKGLFLYFNAKNDINAEGRTMQNEITKYKPCKSK